MQGLPGWILDRYEVQERIGGGVYSEVFRAVDRVRGDTFAIKVLRPDQRNVERVRDRFVAEAQAMARLVHPNVVRIFDVGGALSAEPAIVMEYVPGGDLRHMVRAQQALNARDTAHMAYWILSGLEEAHDAGVVHRGLCPEAILLDARGHPKVSDFGVARLRKYQKATATMTVETLGSLFYSSPEQRRQARGVDARADVYAVGALIWFMQMGKDPFDLSEAAHSPGVVKGIHEVLRPIVVRATSGELDRRYADAGEMKAAVDALFRAG